MYYLSSGENLIEEIVVETKGRDEERVEWRVFRKKVVVLVVALANISSLLISTVSSCVSMPHVDITTLHNQFEDYEREQEKSIPASLTQCMGCLA